jgi:hypothetical protein
MATSMAFRPSKLCFGPVQHARYRSVLVPCGKLGYLNHRFRVSCSSGEKRKSGEVLVERGITGGVPVIEKLEKDEDEDEATEKWLGLPKRYKLIGATSLAFVICNMDKVQKGCDRETITVTWYQSVPGIENLKPFIRPKWAQVSACVIITVLVL